MKFTRMICLTGIGIMAFVGPSSASATGNTAYCSVDAVSCPEGQLIKHLHEVNTVWLFLSSIVNISCITLNLSDVLSPFLAKPLHLIGKSTFEGCKASNGSNCEAKEIGASWLENVLKTSNEKGVSSSEVETLVQCSGFLHCVYDGKGLEAEVLGALLAPPNGEIRLTKGTLHKVSGFLCPSASELDWSRKYLSPTYLTS